MGPFRAEAGLSLDADAEAARGAMLPAALALAASGAHLVALIKPQFEVGKGRVGKGGIVREPALHEEVCTTVSEWLAAQPGWQVLGVTDSPIEGAEGNKEFLIAATHTLSPRA